LNFGTFLFSDFLVLSALNRNINGYIIRHTRKKNYLCSGKPFYRCFARKRGTSGQGRVPCFL